MLYLVAQSLTLCNSMDCSPPGSSAHDSSPGRKTGVGGHALLQGLFPTQESKPGLPLCRWILYHLNHQGSPVQFSSVQFSRSVMSDSLRPHGLQLARLLCPWGFSKQEYWRGLLCPPPGDLPNPGIKARSPALQVGSLPLSHQGSPRSCFPRRN